MTEMKFEPKGPMGWCVGGIIALFAMMGHMGKTIALEEQGREAIETYLMADYSRHTLPELQEALEENASEERMEELMQKQLGTSRIILNNIEVRLGDDDKYHARVEVSVDGGVPPDGEGVRYLLMGYSSYAGWRVERDDLSSSFSLAKRRIDNGKIRLGRSVSTSR